MREEFRYRLDKSSKKHHCPQCSKKRFVMYCDVENNEYLPDYYGRCDREAECGYHLNPYLDGYSEAIRIQESAISSKLPTIWKQQYQEIKPKLQPIYFDFYTFEKTLSNYEKNNLIQNLLKTVEYPFDIDDIQSVVQLYRLGTVANGYRAGATTFPFIDYQNNVRAVQVKQFDEKNHTTGTDFLHSIIEKHYKKNDMIAPEWLDVYKNQDKKISCLFGEHLLSKFPNNPIALVEAPKTAVYGTLYFGFPEREENLIWLAVYNKGSFSIDKMRVLKGRNVIVFPDLSKDGNTYREWKDKSEFIESKISGLAFTFSDLLERNASQEDKNLGLDLADILARHDWRRFRGENYKVEISKIVISKYVKS